MCARIPPPPFPPGRTLFFIPINTPSGIVSGFTGLVYRASLAAALPFHPLTFFRKVKLEDDIPCPAFFLSPTFRPPFTLYSDTPAFFLSSMQHYCVPSPLSFVFAPIPWTFLYWLSPLSFRGSRSTPLVVCNWRSLCPFYIAWTWLFAWPVFYGFFPLSFP